jgi:DNA-binding NtrC family response regulator
VTWGIAITAKRKQGFLVLIEPDSSVRDALTVLLRGEGWEVRDAADCLELQQRIEEGAAGSGPVAVISEASLPQCTAQEILEMGAAHQLPVVFTGHDLSLQGAVDLIRQGATDFLDKPFPQSRLLDLLERLARGQNGPSARQS